MPMIFEAIWRNRLIHPEQIHTDHPLVIGRSAEAPPIDLESLRQVHTDRYLKALFTGEPLHLATSQGLPFWNESIARGWLLNVGGLYAAAKTALVKKTITANLGHGYHHATANRGSGFCTINGLVVVAHKLIREGMAKQVMIIDLDQHEGNGTAECIIGHSRIWNVSIFGSPMGGPPTSENNRVFQVQHGMFEIGERRDVHYLAVISEILPKLIKHQNPDLILYQAGMDPYDSAGITKKALAIRDAYVFALARLLHIPVTWVLAGGYSDMDTLIELHTGTVRMAHEVLAKVNPGDRMTHRGITPYEWNVQDGTFSFPDWTSLLSGKLQMDQPPFMRESHIKEFIKSRNALFKEEKLPDDKIDSAYRRLFSWKPLP